MDKLTVRGFMTPSPHTVSARQPLSSARELMRDHRVRHLPVMHGEALVGVLSDRDIALAAALSGATFERLVVAEAMTPEPHTITPDSSLEWVATEMARQRFGSLIVVEHDKVVGIFTTVDALRALQEMLARARRRRRGSART
jgi:acetoin utilization protein AcuB